MFDRNQRKIQYNAVMGIALFVAFVGIACSSTFAAQTKPSESHGNPEAAKVKNPVAKSPESIAAGKRTYQRLCVRCHGATGKGDGGGATGGGEPSDLTDDVWDNGGSDGEIFAVIHDGVSADMQGYADTISDTGIWNLINFIRSIGPEPNQSTPAKDAKPPKSAPAAK